MTLPLVVLAALTIAAGLVVGVPSADGTAFARFLAPVLPLPETEHGGAGAFALVVLSAIVAVGGVGTIKGPLVAALILGIFDVAGKYYVPQVGAFVIYVMMVALLLLFPAGLYGRRA